MDKLNHATLIRWYSEMSKCAAVDKSRDVTYFLISAQIDRELGQRMAHFIDRHGLWDKFSAEDEAGER
jgi:hypothetical protein